MLAAVVLGVGIGGFLDGIVAHQLLGWSPREDMTLMVCDGLSRLLCLVLVLVGLALLDRRAPLPERVLLGGIFSGWGVVSLVEGLAGRPGLGQLAYDLVFLASGAVLLVIGTLFARRARG